MRPLVMLLALLLGLVAGACAPAIPSGDPRIDTWPIGASLDCAERDDCQELVRVGLAGLDVRDPGHAPVVSTRLHREGSLIDPRTGDQILLTRSGSCCTVLVADLSDGTRRAIGVGYPGISQEPIAIDWELVPGG